MELEFSAEVAQLFHCINSVFQFIGQLLCCWLHSVESQGRSGPGFSSSTGCKVLFCLLLRGFPPPAALAPLLQVFVQALRETIQAESVSSSLLHRDCTNVLILAQEGGQYRGRNERWGHEQLGILLALVFVSSCCRAYVKSLPWLSTPCILNMLMPLGSN